MRIAAGLLGAVTILLVLVEFFLTYLLPRRVKRDPRLARQLYDVAWRPWRWVGRRLRPRAADTLLGLFGPIGLIGVLSLWAIGLILGFAALFWATHAHDGQTHVASFASDLYFSAGSLFSVSTSLVPHGALGEVARVAEAASGFGVIFIVIGYLPSLYQSFSRREIAVSQLDPRAGSPPTAGALLLRSTRRGSWEDLNRYLRDWQEWMAELMETHLSYPVLSYFRSQHVNQNWLAALTTIMDTATFAIAAAPEGEVVVAAEVTYRIGRHALGDLSYSFRLDPLPCERPRLARDEFEQLLDALEEAGVPLDDVDSIEAQLDDLVATYEPYANALATHLAIALPAWMPAADSLPNWRRTAGHRRGGA